MIPFRIDFEPGIPIYEQVVYAAKRAVVSRQMRPGDSFPSVRELSREFKINPNTAHKVVLHLVSEGILEVRPGIGTVVAAPRESAAGERSRLVGRELEQLVVEALRLGLGLDDVTEALNNHWAKLNGASARSKP